MVDYFLWNSDAAGFHLSNILLHVAAGLLLYRLLTLLFQPGRGLWKNCELHSPETGALVAFLIAGLWMVHPVHSAAVDYISGRADSLAFLFSAGAWLLVLSGRGVNSRLRKGALYFAAALSGLLGLCSREIACIWILVFLVHTLAFAPNMCRRAKILTVICCALVLSAYDGLRRLPPVRSDTPCVENWSSSVRATLMLRALGDYGRLMVFPSNLHMERSIFDPDNYRDRQSWRRSAGSEYLSIIGLIVLIGFAYGCAKPGNGRAMRILGAVWLFAAYLPVSNIVQLNATVAEHWLYLPSVGFLIFLAGCALELPHRFRGALAATALFAMIALSVRSAIRSSDWSDQERFYKRTLASGGTSARVSVNLAQIYANRGEYAVAEKMLRQVLESTPDYPIARNNLASVLAQEGKNADAESLLARSAKEAKESGNRFPRTWIAALNLAAMRSQAKDDSGAIAILERAHAEYPWVWDLVGRESEMVRRTQGPLPALRLVENYVQQNWWHHAAWLAEGRLYAENNDAAQAIGALRYAAMLDVHDVKALDLLAQILLRGGRLEDALAAQRRAVARQPYEPRQYLMLAEVLDKLGRTDEAQKARDQVARLQAMAASERIAAN
jgi:tetratricopeptide (TPR) repeat protein